MQLTFNCFESEGFSAQCLERSDFAVASKTMMKNKSLLQILDLGRPSFDFHNISAPSSLLDVLFFDLMIFS